MFIFLILKKSWKAAEFNRGDNCVIPLKEMVANSNNISATIGNTRLLFFEFSRFTAPEQHLHLLSFINDRTWSYTYSFISALLWVIVVLQYTPPEECSCNCNIYYWFSTPRV